MFKRYVIAILLTLFLAMPSTAGDTLDFDATKKLAEQGDVTAQVELGDMYRYGRGVPEDISKAIMWYTQAAEQGDERAQNRLGHMYKSGLDVPQDGSKAVIWYTQAAAQGDVTAQVELGDMYRYGYDSTTQNSLVPRLLKPMVYGYVYDGLPQDYTEAVKWYTKAAEQGHSLAQRNLGLMYYKGQGVPQNYEQAYIWSSLAAAQSPAPEDAAKNRDMIAKELPPEQLIAAQKRAVDVQKRIAEKPSQP
jgi:TPR repeat protein